MGNVKEISEIIKEISPYYNKQGKPDDEYTLIYDSATEQLEPLYFFILDLMNDMGLKTEKLMDNFTPSPGSGNFSELGMKKSTMQQQGTKLLADINTVLRSILNIVYDLREFRIKLQSYDDLKDPKKKEAAILSLKQIWLDKVDIEKGNSSVKAMAFGQQSGFATLIDAFLASKNTEDAKKIDLNDRVKRILIPRLGEFNAWIGHSEKELRKRYEIEKTYLKSQVNSLKLYSRWAKPYLKAAEELEMTEKRRDPNLVKIFDTMVLELTIMGKRSLNVKDSAIEGIFPDHFRKESFLKKLKRGYNSCILIDFGFRGIPQKVGQQSHFAFGGRATVKFQAYALNDDELALLNQKLDESDIDSGLGLIKGLTEDSLGHLKEDIEYFIGDEEEIKEKKPKDTSNPFLALFGVYNSKEKKVESKKPERITSIMTDNWFEKDYFRKQASASATKTMLDIFDIYKKAHGMASYT